MASFMSGMAGSVTAFNTVWTYDIYQAIGGTRRYTCTSHMRRWPASRPASAPRHHVRFNNIMDMLQLVFSFVNAPLLRHSCSAFLVADDRAWRVLKLLAGTTAASLHYESTAVAGSASLFPKLAVWHVYPSDMAQNLWGAIWAWTTCFVLTIVISLATTPRARADLVGLVRGLTPMGSDEARPWYARPAVLAVIVLTMTAALNIWFW